MTAVGQNPLWGHIGLNVFPESGRRKSLFDHLAGARPFARRLHLHCRRSLSPSAVPPHPEAGR
jgi:hypothetical protein